jgi:hypothetical protein
MLIFLGWPMYDGLRGQPRFERIVRDIGLVLPPLPGAQPNANQ